MKLQFFVLFFCLNFLLFVLGVKSDNTDIVINEIGASEETGFEWVEIYNRGNEPIDLTGWKFWEGGVNHGLTVKQEEAVLPAGAFALIVQDDVKFLSRYPGVTSTLFDSSWGTLSEDGEEIGLKFSAGTEDFVERFVYLSTDNFSLERKDANIDDWTQNNWLEHESGNTLGARNSLSEEPIEEGESEETETVEENQLPLASFTLSSSTLAVGEIENFDASSSTDPDGSIEAYRWNFGDGDFGQGIIFEHRYTATGTYTLELRVQDNRGAEAFATSSIEVVAQIIGEEEMATSLNEENVSTTPFKVIINEFLPNPSEGKEWIELFNLDDHARDLMDFSLSDETSVFARITSTIEAGGFLVIEINSSKLNNDGDNIFLKNSSDEIVDKVSYGASSEKAKVPQKGNTLAREDASDSDSDEDDFQETTTPTKGEANRITSPLLEPKTTSPSVRREIIVTPSENKQNLKVYNEGDVVINELVSDPQSGEEEFIELFNNTRESIDLKNWKVQDGSKTNTELQGTLSARSFFVIEKPKGNLNNAGDVVLLFDPSGKEIDRVSYGNWDLDEGKENAPIANDPMSLARVSDGVDTDEDKKDFSLTVKITKAKSNSIFLPELGREENVSEEKTYTTSTQIEGQGKIIISEIFPNPRGDESEEEFIELFNPTTSTLSLVGWKLADSSEKRYTIQEKKLEPLSYAVFKRKVTGIALNNTGGDEVSVYDAFQNLVEKVVYTETAEENQSYARDKDGNFFWTSEITLGENNIFRLEETEKEESEKVQTKKTTAKKVSIKKVLGKKIVAAPLIALQDIREHDKGSLVKVQGQVAVLPGVFGSQYFYLVDNHFGVQVYVNKKDFPPLKVGDSVEVSGEMSEAYGETRINALGGENIVVKASGDLVSPEILEIASMDESSEGAWIQIEGEVTEIKTSYMYVDDGTSEIKVYFKKGTGISKNDVLLGSTVQVKGIVSQSGSGYQILPRAKEDIQVLKSEPQASSQVLEEKQSSKEKFDGNYFRAGFWGALFLSLGFLGKAYGFEMVKFFQKLKGEKK